jgi:4-coumarate--CoA ligase
MRSKHIPLYPEDDRTGSVGRFLPGLDVKLVDDGGNDVTDYDVHTELCIRGPTVIQGHLDEKAHASSWYREGFFHTGDVAYCAKETGLWYMVDRKKELIKVRGFQVAPPELEAVLQVLSHPQITDAAAVVGAPSKAVTENEADIGSEFPCA